MMTTAPTSVTGCVRACPATVAVINLCTRPTGWAPMHPPSFSGQPSATRSRRSLGWANRPLDWPSRPWHRALPRVTTATVPRERVRPPRVGWEVRRDVDS